MPDGCTIPHRYNFLQKPLLKLKIRIDYSLKTKGSMKLYSGFSARNFFSGIEADNKSDMVSFVCFSFDLAAMLFHNRFDHGQTDSVSAAGPASGGIRPVKAIEQMTLCLF